jgi:transposase InsO family protein
MPWKESRIMNERMKFVGDVLKGERTMTELCRTYGIARKTGYKWMERYQVAGPSGLEDLTHRPKKCPQATPEEIVNQVLEVRYKYPTWGAKKIRARLELSNAAIEWPAVSTVGEILKRAGLVCKSKHRRRVMASEEPCCEANAPNHLWCMDFKGFFRCQNRQRCDTFTISDAYSRFLIRCEAIRKTDSESVDAICDSAMREFGMPERIRTDNGVPFASSGLLGLSRLGLKWIRLGIAHERIDPGMPTQNARHERLHRTLKQDAATPPAADLLDQQKRFLEFRQVYNFERPHEALDLATPGSAYVPSPRELPKCLPPIEYGPDFVVRRVKNHGEFGWNNEHVFISTVLSREVLGFLPIAEDVYQVWWGNTWLGDFDAWAMKFNPRKTLY